MSIFLDSLHCPYVMMVGDHGGYDKRRAYFEFGMYWIKRAGKRYPLSKKNMSRTSYELVEANVGMQPGDLYRRMWCPLNERMLAWYDMLPNETDKPQPTDPQMPS